LYSRENVVNRKHVIISSLIFLVGVLIVFNAVIRPLALTVSKDVGDALHKAELAFLLVPHVDEGGTYVLLVRVPGEQVIPGILHVRAALGGRRRQIAGADVLKLLPVQREANPGVRLPSK
jgi:hypothetical protein